ncbi:MAG: hypothetical protein IPM18_12860 [Phycisphaerales bacterium]|nr:hypothetical protein [Phycisphaerales bacterium]
MEFLRNLFEFPLTAVFVTIVLGLGLGQLQFRKIALGSSGVLFVALAMAQFGLLKPDYTAELGQFGVVLFVYAIGLQAGPRFVQTLRRKGAVPLVVVLGTVGGAGLVAGFGGYILGLPRETIAGVFAGALTSTPALAAATEAAGVEQAQLVSIAYGLSYPLGVVGVVLFAQLVPKWLARRPARQDEQADTTPGEEVRQRCFLVQNPGCIGKTLSELRLHDWVSAVVSRIARGSEIIPSSRNPKLERGDVVLAVGTNHELDRLGLLIGPPVPAEIEMADVPNVIVRDVFITERRFAGRSLRALHIRSKFGVVITRVRRDGVEFVPRGEFVLEVGDLVRIVGYEHDVRAFSTEAGIHERRLHETAIPPFAFGLVLGLLLGYLPFPVPGGGTVQLGIAGGPLLMGLLLGHFGRIGKFRVHVPLAGRYLMRELGLVLFLVSAGAGVGTDLWPVLQAQGLGLLVLTLLTLVTGLGLGAGLAYLVCKQTAPSTMGLTCGAMTSTPGLGAASAQFESEVPALSYAAVYPLALVAMTVGAQLMLALM